MATADRRRWWPFARRRDDDPQQTGDANPMDRWLAVGLTNPEGEYGGTRHNVGAAVIRRLASRLSADLKPHRTSALAADTFTPRTSGATTPRTSGATTPRTSGATTPRTSGATTGGTPLTLAVPYGYMNNSGGPVQQLVRFYKTPTRHLILVCDDLDLDLGVVRVKRGGSGGHNGLRDVQQKLAVDDYLRVRVGIGRPPGRMPAAKYVLQRFSSGEQDDADLAIERAADTVLMLVSEGLETTQNRVHST